MQHCRTSWVECSGEVASGAFSSPETAAPTFLTTAPVKIPAEHAGEQAQRPVEDLQESSSRWRRRRRINNPNTASTRTHH